MPGNGGGAGLRRGERKELERDTRKPWGMIDTFFILMTVISRICTYFRAYPRASLVAQ